MHKLIIAAVVVALTAVFWPTSKSKPDKPAQQMARAIAPILPKEMSSGLTFESAVAEGDVLVVGFDVPMSAHLDASEVAKVFAASFCGRDDLRQFFADGGKLRVDVSIGGGSPTNGQIMDSCSA
jgi:hypothetical protein